MIAAKSQRKLVLRADKNNPNKKYTDFWDWLFSGMNCIWTAALVLGYLYYLVNTYEV
jgi:hypothetical protein